MSDNTTEEQRKVLDTSALTSMGGLDMRKIFGVKYVKIAIEETKETIHVQMPFGEMKQFLMKGLDGGPIRIENHPFYSLTLMDTRPCPKNWTRKCEEELTKL